MKLKKFGVVFGLAASIIVLGACSNSKSSTSEHKAVKNETVAFQKDINENNERVWLVVKSDNFGKDSEIESAFHIKNGKTEVISPVASLRDIDKVTDAKVWDYLVKTEQDDYKKHRQEKIDSNTKSLATFQKNEEDGFYPEGEKIMATQIQETKKNLEVLNKTTEFKPLQTKMNVSVTTDSSGNHTSEESIDTVSTDEMYALLENTQLNYDLKSVINSPREILSNSYLGYEMQPQAMVIGGNYDPEHYVMLTRKTSDIKKIAFDKVTEKGVKEAQSNE